MRQVSGRQITSRRNPHFRRWHQLLESRGIRKFQQFLLFGERVVREILRDHQEYCLELLYPPTWPHLLPSPTTVSHYILARQLFHATDLFGTRTPLLVCKTPDIPQWDQQEAPRGLELLCPLGEPSNVGALVRTCQAFGVRKVVLLKEAASPFHPKATRAASGAVLSVQFVQGPSVKELTADTVSAPLVALDVAGNDMSVFQWPKNVRILIGEEGQGLSGHDFHDTVSIPMAANMHSLNAAVAASIAMYAYRLRFPLRKG